MLLMFVISCYSFVVFKFEIEFPRNPVNEEVVRQLANFCPNLIKITGDQGYHRSFETVRYAFSKLSQLHKIKCNVINTKDFIRLFQDMVNFFSCVTNLTIFCDLYNDGIVGKYVEPFFRKLPKLKALRILDRNGKTIIGYKKYRVVFFYKKKGQLRFLCF